jgi:predicted Zn-dependent protease
MKQGLRKTAAALLTAAMVTSGCSALSISEEKQLGQVAQKQIRQQLTLMRDRVVVDYIRTLGDVLVKASEPSPFEFRFYVVEDKTLNAFAIPGGAIYVHTGLILEAQDVSELGGVIAHEIGHVTGRHVAQVYRRQRNTGIVAQIVTVLVSILTSTDPRLTSTAASIAAQAYAAKFTRDNERDADRSAIDTMINAKYDPQGLVRFFGTLQAEGGGGGGPQFLSSHPATEERIENAKRDIEAKGEYGKLRTDDNGRLEIIQERIRLLAGTDAGIMTEDEVEDEGEEP